MKIRTFFSMMLASSLILPAIASADDKSIYDPQSTGEKTQGKVLIISADNFNDTEMLYPLYRLIEAGYDVTVASPDGGTIKGYNSAEIPNTKKVADIQPQVAEFTALYLPGGRAPAKLRDDDTVIEVVKAFAAANKPIGAICHGPQILITAGLADGKKMTAVEDVAKEIRDANGTFVDDAVIVDGNIVTSRLPGDLPVQLPVFLKMLNQES